MQRARILSGVLILAAFVPSAFADGAVSGSAKFEGTPPERKTVKVSADPVCQKQHQAEPVLSEDVVVNENGALKNVFVYVKEGVQGTPPAKTEKAVLDQKGCWYTPHVLGVQVGQPVEITNSDATLHNVNAKPGQNKPFNLAQPAQNMKAEKKFDKPELGIPVKCNVHPWMLAYINVVSNPFFAVTDDQGKFEITGLPAGSYVLEAWHEKLGTKTQNVTVADGQAATAEFSFAAAQ